jgi:Lipocalin-like domain
MKQINKFAGVISIIFFLAALAGCKKESSNPSSSISSTLAGTWVLSSITAVTSSGIITLTADQANEHITVVLGSDATFSSTTIDASGTTQDGGTYSFDANTITLKSKSGDTLVWTYTLNGSDLQVKSTITVASLGTVPVTLDFKKQ